MEQGRPNTVEISSPCTFRLCLPPTPSSCLQTPTPSPPLPSLPFSLSLTHLCFIVSSLVVACFLFFCSLLLGGYLRQGWIPTWAVRSSWCGQIEAGKCRRMKGEGRKHTTASPCAACKLLRRRCTQGCVFAPHFPSDEPQKFASVHKVFGASNVSKLLREIAAQHRGDAVSSLVYEANARVRDPVYGCVGAITSLHCQIQALQAQLAVARAKMLHLRMSHAAYLARFTHTAMATASTSYTGSSSMSPEHKQLMEPDTTKSVFPLDMAMLDQSNLGEPQIWSC
ncbi:LOB domain-containing protein 4-like [Musa acuminata AAA Group]|uniref:LOB domain-containing protein 4-like n=1 Tax=Musa acuminata AAA Group TaxID=214697 RepID=UPI0031CDDB3C